MSASAETGDLRNRDACVAEVDRAIAREDGARAERRAQHGATARRLFALPQLMRWMGASVLVVAAFTFMVQSWEHGSDVARYFHFLAFTGVLTGAGFFCGLRIRDEKGARTFLGLAVGAVPVHFTVLGALLYSQFPWLSGLAQYPAYAHFTAPDPAAALFVCAVGVAALVPVCWVAFLTFARPAAGKLTAAYLAANATLLIPTRHPDVIGGVALALLALLALFDAGVLRRRKPLRTPEGRFVRLLMAAPLVILIGRTFNLYDASSLVFAAVFAALAVVGFSVVPALTRTRAAGSAAQYASLVPACAAWLCSVEALTGAFGWEAAAVLPLVCLPLAGIFGALSLYALDGGAPLRRLASVVATGGMAVELLIFPGVWTSLGCLCTAMLAMAHGYAAEQRGVFITGLAALVFGLLYHLRYAAELYALSPWGSLALLGILTVLAASYVERHHRALLAGLTELKSRVDGWSA